MPWEIYFHWQSVSGKTVNITERHYTFVAQNGRAKKKKKNYPESTFPDGRQGVGNAQENGGGAQDPVNRCEAGPVPRFGVRVVVEIHFETLHLVEIACRDIYVTVPFELLEGVWTLLALQVGPPSCHDSWLRHASRHLNRKHTLNEHMQQSLVIRCKRLSW